MTGSDPRFSVVFVSVDTSELMLTIIVLVDEGAGLVVILQHDAPATSGKS